MAKGLFIAGVSVGRYDNVKEYGLMIMILVLYLLKMPVATTGRMAPMQFYKV